MAVLLKQGQSGTDIVQLQNALNMKIIFGYGQTPLVADGSYGPATFAAVKLYQAQNSLPISGVADGATLKKLGIYSIPSIFNTTTTPAKTNTSNVIPVPSSGFSLSSLSTVPKIYYIAGGVLVLGVALMMARASDSNPLKVND